MGSLVPGWDTELGPPRDMRDTDDSEQQPEGYFARLRSHRHSGGGAMDLAAPSLGRSSAPLHAPSLGRTSLNKAAQSPASKTGSMPHGKYQATNWADELSTLKGAQPQSRPQVHHDDHGHDAHAKPGHDAWWARLDVGHLNEHPDAGDEAKGAGAHGTFVPQLPLMQKLDLSEPSA